MMFKLFKFYLAFFFFLCLFTAPLVSLKTDSNPEPLYEKNLPPQDPSMESLYEKSKENLIGLKDTAYQKMVDASHALGSAREGVWEATHSAWNTARDTYEKAKEEVAYYLKTSGDTIVGDYQKARNAFVEAMRNTGDYIQSAKDYISDSYYTQLDKLHMLESESKKKYDETYEKMRQYYNDAYHEARKDLQATEESLAHAQERLQNFMEKSSEKGSEKYEQTRRNLELAWNRAQENYEASKRAVDEIKGKMKDFYDQGIHLSQSYWEATKERAQRATDAMKSFTQDSKNEALENYQSIKQRLTEATNKAQELSNTAGDYFNDLKQKFEEYQNRAKEKVQERWDHMTSAD